MNNEKELAIPVDACEPSVTVVSVHPFAFQRPMFLDRSDWLSVLSLFVSTLSVWLLISTVDLQAE